MSSLLPIRSEPSTSEGEPRVVDLDGEEADEVFSALSSSTAREIVATLHEEPRTQSEISDALDTTVQNVRYHLDKLEDAGLVEVVDTWYSSRGNEMSVYAPADGALIVSSDEREASRIRTALSRLIGGVAVIGLASLVVQFLFGSGSTDPRPVSDFSAGGPSGGAGGDGAAPAAAGDDAAGPTYESRSEVGDGAAELNNSTAVDQAANETTVVETLRETTTVVDGASGTDAATAAASGLPPGVLFFLGGVSVLAVVVAVAYYGGR